MHATDVLEWATAIGTLITASAATYAAFSSHNSAQRLLDIEEQRDGRANVEIDWKKRRDDSFEIWAVNQGPGIARDVRLELLDEKNEPYGYVPDTAAVEVAELAVGDRLPISTNKHTKHGIWVRAHVEWTDTTDARHSHLVVDTWKAAN